MRVQSLQQLFRDNKGSGYDIESIRKYLKDKGIDKKNITQDTVIPDHVADDLRAPRGGVGVCLKSLAAQLTGEYRI